MKGFRLLFLFPFCVLITTVLQAQTKLGETTIYFANASQANKIMTSEDAYALNMSAIDRSVRVKTSEAVSQTEYLEHAARSIREWSEAEREKISNLLIELQPHFKKVQLPFPDSIFFVKTSGDEEGGAPYTRSNGVILPNALEGIPDAEVKRIICHELFHVLSRYNPELRDKLYAVIGFRPCGQIAMPVEYQNRKLTNPDAPLIEHCILVQVEGKDVWSTPVIYSASEKYDSQIGTSLFDYVQFGFMTIHSNVDQNGNETVSSTDIVKMNSVSGFFEQIGANTQYIIHPEEILADNFVLYILDVGDVQSPEILEKIRTVLHSE